MTTELTPPSSTVQTLSAGQKLRQAREQQHLTTAQVAQQLNLSKSLIEDIELDQVDAKLSSTFVRGYLRSYAKLLKIPAQHILDAYSSNSKGLHQVPSLTRSFSKRTATEATENRFMWVTYFVIAVFIVLLVIGFWQSRFGSSASGTALPMAQTDETMQASADAQSAQNSTVDQAVTAPSQPQNEIPVTQLDHSPAAAVTQTQPDVAADVPVVLPAQPQQSTVAVTTASTEDGSVQSAQPTGTGQTPAVATDPAVQSQTPAVATDPAVQSQTPVVETDAAAQSQNPAVVTDAATQPQSQTVPGDSTTVPSAAAQSTNPVTTAVTPAEAQNTPQADAAANASVSLSLAAECWVDVVDATGKRLVFGSRKAGEQLNLRGVAPIKIILGNAAAATLSFNGEAVDLSGYPTGRVARLTLGQN